MTSTSLKDINTKIKDDDIKSFISYDVAVTFKKWEGKVRELGDFHFEGTSAGGDRHRCLDLLQVMSKEVSQILENKLTCRREPPSAQNYSNFTEPVKLSDDMATYIDEWQNKVKVIKDKGSSKRQRLIDLLFEIQERVDFWILFVNETKSHLKQRQRAFEAENDDDLKRKRNSQEGRPPPPQHPTDTKGSREELLHEIQQLKSELHQKEEYYHRNLSEKESYIERLKEEKRRQDKSSAQNKEDVVQLMRQKDEAMNRLSEMAGQKLRQNNPNIVDLNVENRPTKIAERLKQIYDNQWTDALDKLLKKCDEKKAIDLLLNALLDSFKFTTDASCKQLKRLQDSAKMPTFLADTGKPVQLSDECLDLIKQLQKASAPAFVREVQEGFLKRKDKEFKELIKYYNACAEITWYMNVQTPPMVFEEKPAAGKPVTDHYSMYTISGEAVDYVVWPACLLHEKGPLLAKGVVQPSLSRRGNRIK
ncbi:liprin-alpha-1-like isoform X2 [Argopecten irradians]|uniref:liprin-alpha-1-like isoform X2 n=1 Tax=Argopecten irradians TaxID=31199 RepID=UPI003721E3BD